jgi:hypothetical protein
MYVGSADFAILRLRSVQVDDKKSTTRPSMDVDGARYCRMVLSLSGGVGDAYQPAEADFRLARQVLSVLEELGRPVHILTKSCLVERDLDLLEKKTLIPGVNPTVRALAHEISTTGTAELYEKLMAYQA